jgi:tRNA(fMet)-specific endonuclease VapC
MLDTNTVSNFLKRHPDVVQRVVGLPVETLCISTITEGEISFGLAKAPRATNLHRGADEFRKRVDVLPWNSEAASHYGKLRAGMERSGQNLSALDMLIAAHALSIKAVLVTSDQAFVRTPGLAVEDWATASQER